MGAGSVESPADATGSKNADSSYIFRGDDDYRGGPLGRELGADADDADIQNFVDHVLHKESRLTSRYVSFTYEVRIARRFTSSADNRNVYKAEWKALRELESQDIIRIWNADQVYAELKAGQRKLAKQAPDVRAAMRRNREILIEGQIPKGIMQQTN